jgi:exopolysaccharide biosynthesis polyprenyl glycosylphosphotransferase
MVLVAGSWPVPGSSVVRPRYSLDPEDRADTPAPAVQNQVDPSGPEPVGDGRGPAALAVVALAKGEPAAPRQAGPVPRSMYRLLDNTLVLGVLLAALVLRNMGRMPDGLDDFLAIRLSVKNALLFLGFAVAWRGICVLCGLYDGRRIASWRSESQRVVAACLLAVAVALPFPLTSTSGAFDSFALALFWAGATLGMLALRRMLRVAARVRRRPVRNVLIVGTGPRALQMRECLHADPKIDYRVLGFVDSNAPHASEEIQQGIVAGLEDFEATLIHSPVDEVVVTLPMKSCYAQIQHIVDFCESIGVAITLPVDSFRSSRSAFRPRLSPSGLAITLADAPEGAPLIAKRGIDLLGASLVLVACAPLMILTALLIRLTSRGPILFSQERYGYNRRIFRMYKFRTMVVDAEKLQSSLEHLNEAPGPLFKIKRDPRLTLIGGFLRRTSIDELPQLFNVLRGEMSLVGPRPMAIRDVHLFTEATLMRRFSVRPGMTGLWQVTGRSTLDYKQWAACDLRYVEQWSLLGDIKILARTIPAVLRGTGAE